MTKVLLLALACVVCACTSKPAPPPAPRPDPVIPQALPPLLRVVAINILKDELVNTKLKVVLEIQNPNDFPLHVLSLDYRLYGEGKYWANDILKRGFTVAETSSYRANLYLTMNFADMDRALLDKVVRLAEVRYRLTGKLFLDADAPYGRLDFVLPFDLSGVTEVLR